MFKLDQIKEAFSHAFKITDGKEEMVPEDYEILEKLAKFVVKRKLSVPAIMFLETMRPLNMVGSSMMSFFKPTIGNLFNQEEYRRLEAILQRRCSVGELIETIEKMDNDFKLEKENNKEDSK